MNPDLVNLVYYPIGSIFYYTTCVCSNSGNVIRFATTVNGRLLNLYTGGTPPPKTPRFGGTWNVMIIYYG